MKTWYDARDYCRALGGDLASFHGMDNNYESLKSIFQYEIVMVTLYCLLCRFFVRIFLAVKEIKVVVYFPAYIFLTDKLLRFLKTSLELLKTS